MKFRTLPAGFDAVKKRMIITSMLVVVIVGAVVVAPGLLSEDPIRRQSSLLTGAILVAIFIITTTLRIRKQKEQYLSFVVTIEDNLVTREMIGAPRVAISMNDVTRIVKGYDGRLHVMGSKKTDQILIPSKMENHEEMNALLGSIKPFTESKKNYSFVPLLSLLATGFVLAGAFLVRDPIVNTISVALLFALMAASLVIIQRSTLVEKRIKRLSWITLIPLLSFLYILITRIKGL